MNGRSHVIEARTSRTIEGEAWLAERLLHDRHWYPVAPRSPRDVSIGEPCPSEYASMGYMSECTLPWGHSGDHVGRESFNGPVKWPRAYRYVFIGCVDRTFEPFGAPCWSCGLTRDEHAASDPYHQFSISQMDFL